MRKGTMRRQERKRMTRAVDSLTVAAISMSLSLDLTMLVKLFHARFAGFCFFCLNETIQTLSFSLAMCSGQMCIIVQKWFIFWL